MSPVSKIFFTAFCALALEGVHAQQYHLIEIQNTQTFYLNNATRDALGTGDNETYLRIELPPLTKEWYYSFSAVQAERGQSLNLLSQLTQLIDPSGVTSSVIDAVTVPEGNIRCNIYLTDHGNAMASERDVEFNYWTSGTRKSYTEGVVKVTDILHPFVYLCFENPNSWDGMTISVEVAALVADKSAQEVALENFTNALGDFAETLQDSKAQKQLQSQQNDQWGNYWKTGWLLFEAGNYDQAMEYTEKALNMKEHPGLYFNLGLIQWAKDTSVQCMETYLKGLNAVYGLESKEEAINTLSSAMDAINACTERMPGLEKPEVPYKLLASKLQEVQGIANWKRK